MLSYNLFLLQFYLFISTPCSIEYFIHQLNDVYTEEEKKIIKSINIEDFASGLEHYKYDNENEKQIFRIKENRCQHINKLIKHKIDLKFNSDSICFKYYTNVFDEYILYDWSSVVPMKYIILRAYHNYLNNKPLQFDSLINNFKYQLHLADSVYKRSTNADTLDGIYIPKDFQDALIHLDKIISKKSKKQMLKNNDIEDATLAEHFGVGFRIRNMWKLWGNSRLSIYLQPYCFYNADRMSTLILYGYYLKLHNKPHSLDIVFTYYIDNLKKEGYYESYLETKEQYLEDQRKLQERKNSK